MAITRKFGVLAVGAALSVSGAVALAAPANADVNPANCSYSFNYNNPPRVAATCYNPTNSGWHAYIVCENLRGFDHTQNGVEVYGSGTSLAQCAATGYTIAGYGVVNG